MPVKMSSESVSHMIHLLSLSVIGISKITFHLDSHILVVYAVLEVFLFEKVRTTKHFWSLVRLTAR